MPPQVDMERNATDMIEPLLGQSSAAADDQGQAQEQAPRQEEVSTKSSRIEFPWKPFRQGVTVLLLQKYRGA